MESTKVLARDDPYVFPKPYSEPWSYSSLVKKDHKI